MEIRTKLTYQFLAIVAIILLLAYVSIYLSFSQSRREEFYGRLENKANLIAQLLWDDDEVSASILKSIDITNYLRMHNEEIIVYDGSDSLVYNTDLENLVGVSLTQVNQARQKNKIRYSTSEYEIAAVFFSGSPRKLVVFVAATDIFGFSKLFNLRVILVIVFILSLVIVYFAGRVFSSRALAPVTNIITSVNNISATNLDRRIVHGNENDELAKLADTFNGMLDRLETAFKTQKDFIANASHELRTPLTVITGQIEVVLMKERTGQDYLKTLDSVLNEIKKLNNLSNRLLLLAQASADINEESFLAIRIDDILWNVRTDILKRKKKYSVNISFSENITDEAKLVVFGNEMLLRTAISNLIDNACKYSTNNTSDIFIDADESNIYLHFTDSGIGISEDDIKSIFEPFFRAHNARGVSGHGIGLSLVDKILKQHNGKIRVLSTLGKGSQFIISLPFRHLKF
jgi:signal transduction histidine kinase